jgi:hypothetical protein
LQNRNSSTHFLDEIGIAQLVVVVVVWIVCHVCIIPQVGICVNPYP